VFIKPSYVTVLVRNDGNEFGMFSYGGINPQFRSIFPPDLHQNEKVHATAADAYSHINGVWMENNGVTDTHALGLLIHRQQEHVNASHIMC
jgi:hypothetical protein